MKLNDIANMSDYLENDCYCPGEIYDISGFFFRVFKPDYECVLLIEGKSKKNEDVVCVICDDQIINFLINDNKIISAERYDATENNIKFMKTIWSTGDVTGMEIDEFEKGKTKKCLDEIMKYADAILYS